MFSSGDWVGPDHNPDHSASLRISCPSLTAFPPPPPSAAFAFRRDSPFRLPQPAAMNSAAQSVFAFGTLARLRLAPPPLAWRGTVDFAGAFFTMLALRRSASVT